MFLRWPAAVIVTVVSAYVLFRFFTWALNSTIVSKHIRKVTNPRAESVDDIAEDLTAARQLRDDRLDDNQAAIDESIEEQRRLRELG